MTVKWRCDHDADQWGGKRCVRCCTAVGLQYVWRKPAGGSPGAWRWLCPACLAVYREIGLVDGPQLLVDRAQLSAPNGQTRTALGRFVGLRVVA